MFIMKCLFIFGGWFRYTSRAGNVMSSVDRSIWRRWLLAGEPFILLARGALGMILSAISECTIDRLVHIGDRWVMLLEYHAYFYDISLRYPR